MKPSLKKFAPAGLFLALAAALFAGGWAIVHKAFDLPVQISLGLIVVGLALFVLLDPRRTRELLTGRQARHGSNAALLVLAFAGILVVANILVSSNSPSWDLTEDKTNTLSQESLDVIASLKSPVKAEGYFSSRTSSASAQALLEKIKKSANGKFDYEFIDPEANPIQAQNANITRDGTIVLVQGDRSEQVTYADESEIVNAMVRIDNPGQRSVYFLTGHGEYDPEGSGERGYTTIKQTLTNKNYTVSKLNLAAERQIPADALALIIAGPSQPLLPEEIELIQAYVAGGGSLVVLSEPSFVTGTQGQTDNLAAYLSADWGITLSDDLVIDANYNPPVMAVAASYGQHEITTKMQNEVIILPTARSVQTVQSALANISPTTLVLTSQNSWSETSEEQLTANQITPDEGADLMGPIPLAVAAANTNTNARVVVVGDADFASDNYVTQYGNDIFMANVVDWAAGQENLINLTARQTTQRSLVLRDQTMLGLILLGTVILPPALVVVAGIVVWFRRRRKG